MTSAVTKHRYPRVSRPTLLSVQNFYNLSSSLPEASCSPLLRYSLPQIWMRALRFNPLSEKKRAKYNCCDDGKCAILAYVGCRSLCVKFFTIVGSTRNREHIAVCSRSSYSVRAGCKYARGSNSDPLPCLRCVTVYTTGTKISNSSSIYICDTECAHKVVRLDLNDTLAIALRYLVHNQVPSARQQYRFAVDEVLGDFRDLPDFAATLAFITFTYVSRVDYGPVIGQLVSAPSTAAVIYKDAERKVQKYTLSRAPTQSFVYYHYEVQLTSPSSTRYCLSMVSQVGLKETFSNFALQGHTIRHECTENISLLVYCRQRLVNEELFKTYSCTTQECFCDPYVDTK